MLLATGKEPLMKKLVGLIVVLVILYGVTIANMVRSKSAINNVNLARAASASTAFISLGVAAVIISGGIDLSIGSFMGFARRSWRRALGVRLVAAVRDTSCWGSGVVAGTIHGLLVTKAKFAAVRRDFVRLIHLSWARAVWGNDTNSGLGLGFTEFRTAFAEYQILGLPVSFGI